MVDYISDSLFSAGFHVAVSIVPSCAVRLGEIYTNGPDPNPFWFAAAYTVFVDYMRYREDFPFKVDDNPAIFVSAAVVYTMIEKFWF